MSQEHNSNNPDGNGKSLSSTEYRHRLLNKLGCLISVLEVALGKIGSSLDEDGSNQDRLSRIQSNLENTLAICRRAKATLEKRIAEDGGKLPTTPNTPTPPKPGCEIDQASLTFRSYVELSSIDEFRKFKNLEAISKDEIKKVDLDDLAEKFFGND
jgi:hypothetical protein